MKNFIFKVALVIVTMLLMSMHSSGEVTNFTEFETESGTIMIPTSKAISTDLEINEAFLTFLNIGAIESPPNVYPAEVTYLGTITSRVMRFKRYLMYSGIRVNNLDRITEESIKAKLNVIRDVKVRLLTFLSIITLAVTLYLAISNCPTGPSIIILLGLSTLLMVPIIGITDINDNHASVDITILKSYSLTLEEPD